MQTKDDGMKKKICSILFIVLLLMCSTVTASEIPVRAGDISSEATINVTQHLNELRIFFSLKDTYTMDTILHLPQCVLKDKGNDKVIVASTELTMKIVKKSGFYVIIEKNAKTDILLAYFKNSSKQFYVDFDSDLKIQVSSSDILLIDSTTIQTVSKRDSYILSPNQINEIIAGYGYDNMYRTKIDAASTVEQTDSLESEGLMTFDYSMTTPIGNNTMRFTGALTSNVNDPSSFVSIKPVVYLLSNKSHLTAECGYDLNQNGKEKRLTVDIHGSYIGPNLIDLTSNFDRLRLKPSIQYGVNGYYYTKSELTDTKEEFLVEPYLSLYYYIPVMEKYYLLVDADFFYRSNKDFEFLKDNARWKWEITLGIELPGVAPKVMAKYSGGTNSVTFEKDNRALVGLVMDLFPKEKEK